MLYALSTIDAMKFRDLSAALNQAFQLRRVPSAAPAGAAAPAEGPIEPLAKGGGPSSTTELGAVRDRLMQRLARDLAQKRVSIEIDPRGLVISIREAGSFAPSSAELSDAVREMLVSTASAISDIGNHIRVEGHTDDVPISSTRFASNWELSTARATTVVRFLLEQVKLPPTRISAAGYAEYQPYVPNDSELGRARNRRVDIVILNPATQLAEEPDHTPKRASSQ